MSFQKISPSIEELEVESNSQIACKVAGCHKNFKTIQAHQFHIQKEHQTESTVLQCENAAKSSKEKGCAVKKQYHCPVAGCVYQPSSERHFSCMKYLKQHYQKVHKAKNMECSRCQKKFSTKTLMEQHKRYCGSLFKCGTCDNVYSSKEVLQNHCKRKQHALRLDANHIITPANSAEEIQQVVNKNVSEACSSLGQQMEKAQTAIPPEITSTITVATSAQNAPAGKKDPFVTQTGRSDVILGSSGKPPKGGKDTGLHRLLLPAPDAFVICMNKSDPRQPPSIIQVANVVVPVVKSKLRTLQPKPESTNEIVTSPNLSADVNCTLSLVTKHTTETQTEGHQVPRYRRSLSNVQDTAVQAKPRKRNVVAQTTGDYILQTAMKNAKLPLHRGKARGKKCKYAESQSSQTQISLLMDKRSRKAKSFPPTDEVESGVSSGVATPVSSQSANVTLAMDDLQDLLASIETQTTGEWEDVQPGMAESNYTQTAESFLANSWSNNMYSSSETQTSMSMEQCKTASRPSKHRAHGHIMLDDQSSKTFMESNLAMNSQIKSYSNNTGLIQERTCTATISIPHREVMLSDSATISTADGIHNTYTSIETQTSIPEFQLAPCLPSDNQTHASSGVNTIHMETQTMHDVVEEFFNHMETQTSDDFLADFGLADMETQTTFAMSPDPTLDVQTQTSLHGLVTTMDNAPSTDMETQTFFPEFENCTDSHTQTTLGDLEQLMSDLS